MTTGLPSETAALLNDFCEDQRRSLEHPFSDYLDAGAPHRILTLQARRDNQGPLRTVPQALRQHRHLVLLGEAGAGKTTALRELHRRALERLPTTPHLARALTDTHLVLLAVSDRTTSGLHRESHALDTVTRPPLP